MSLDLEPIAEKIRDAFTAKQEGQGLLLFRFDQPEAAIATLKAEQVNVVSTIELFRRLGG